MKPTPVGVIPIPDTPRQLLEVAAVLDRVRAFTERVGDRWPTLDEEFAAREALLRGEDP